MQYVTGLPLEKGAIDLYAAYYTTLALFQVQDPRWTQWNRRLVGRLVPTQRKEGPLAGSWDPDSRWSAVGGRVYTTTLSCLCLQTYYRYLPLYKTAGQPVRWR